MTLTFGFTPCPNDAFAFHALVHRLVPAPFEVEPVLLDIEELNQRAAHAELQLTKLSFGAVAAAAGDRYRLLRSGAALGHGVGPLVVAREAGSLEEFAAGRIAVPGRETTAFFETDRLIVTAMDHQCGHADALAPRLDAARIALARSLL